MRSVSVLLLLGLIVGIAGVGRADNWTNEQIANAIWFAEGGTKTKYPYGIKSIDTKGDKEYARKICLNTIRNNRVRFAKQNKYTDFVEFLGNRYCPPKAHKLNKYWVKNVKYFLNKGGSK